MPSNGICDFIFLTLRGFLSLISILSSIVCATDCCASNVASAATKVILLDPVSGSYEFRKNTEGQAIGRAHRTGQTKQVSVVRFIIKDTIEEEIYKEFYK